MIRDFFEEKYIKKIKLKYKNQIEIQKIKINNKIEIGIQHEPADFLKGNDITLYILMYCVTISQINELR